MSVLYPDVTVRHARELVAGIEETGIGAMSRKDMAYTIGSLKATVARLLEVVDDDQ